MITRIKSKRIIKDDSFFDGYLYINDSIIEDITNNELPFDVEIDASEKIVAPGFIDIHVHGGAGLDFSTADVEDIKKILDFHLSHGTTTIYPTLSSYSTEVYYKSLSNLRSFKKQNLSKVRFNGVHMEGPYFSLNQCGAQSADIITPPKKEQYESILRDFDGLISRWSYAPELDEDMEFSRYLKDKGIVSAIGHSDAIYDDCMKAYNEGCKLITHLYSCTSTITRDHGFRRLGIIETAYLYDDIVVEIIADGKHLPPDLIKMIYKIKGDDEICLVTDAIAAAGCDEGYPAPIGFNFIVEDGVAKLPDRTAFAGSIATTDRLLRVCIKEAQIPLISAVKMITENPARVMGLKNTGALKKGYDADIVIFDDDINIEKVFVLGK